MAAQETRTPARSGGGKILGLPATAVYLGAAALVAGIAYIWFRHRGASSSGTSAAANATGAGCFDASGNATPCPSTSVMDYSGQFSTLQTELQNLAGAETMESECPQGYTFTPSPGGAATGAAPSASAATGTTNTGTTSSGATTSGPGPLPSGSYQVGGGVCVPSAPSSTPAPKPTGVQRYPAPTGCKIINKGRQNFELSWNEVTDPATGTKAPSYTVEVWQLNGKVVWQHVVTAPIDNVFGLTPGWSYAWKVWANGGKLAPSGCGGTVTGV